MKFDKPLDTWIDETVMVREVVPEIDKEKNRVKLTYKDVPYQQKTMYVNPIAQNAKCEDGQHNWRCEDKHKYLFACSKCPYHFQAYPTTYKFEDNHLIHKFTGRVI
jgi:hypothetical protein